MYFWMTTKSWIEYTTKWAKPIFDIGNCHIVVSCLCCTLQYIYNTYTAALQNIANPLQVCHFKAKVTVIIYAHTLAVNLCESLCTLAYTHITGWPWPYTMVVVQYSLGRSCHKSNFGLTSGSLLPSPPLPLPFYSPSYTPSPLPPSIFHSSSLNHPLLFPSPCPHHPPSAHSILPPSSSYLPSHPQLYPLPFYEKSSSPPRSLIPFSFSNQFPPFPLLIIVQATPPSFFLPPPLSYTLIFFALYTPSYKPPHPLISYQTPPTFYLLSYTPLLPYLFSSHYTEFRISDGPDIRPWC